jgi:hypothetical protein
MNPNFLHPEDPQVPHSNLMRNEDCFKVPTAYFDTLAEKIIIQIEQDALPEAIKEKSFVVPDQYFETLTQRVMDSIPFHKQSKTIQTGFRRSWVYAAAAAVVLIVISWWGIQLFNSNYSTDYLAAVSEEELLEYVSDHEYEFDQQTLASIVSEDDLNSIEIIDEVDSETTELLLELYK